VIQHTCLKIPCTLTRHDNKIVVPRSCNTKTIFLVRLGLKTKKSSDPALKRIQTLNIGNVNNVSWAVRYMRAGIRRYFTFLKTKEISMDLYTFISLVPKLEGVYTLLGRRKTLLRNTIFID